MIARCQKSRICTGRGVVLLLLATATIMLGCSQRVITKEFGSVTDEARSSLNGLGIHKRMWEQAGAKCLTPRNLSSKLEKADVIVLVPQTFDAPGREARKWLEDWLSRSPGRTLIYFGRDFNAELLYLQEMAATEQGAEKDRLQLELGISQISEHQNRLDSYTESTFCGWFYLDSSRGVEVVTDVEGPWATEIDADELQWPVRTRLLPPAEDQKAKLPSWLSGKGALPKVTPPPAIVFSKKMSTPTKDDKQLIVRSNWINDELSNTAEWDKEFEDLPDSEVLMATNQGDPLVFRLTSDSRFGDGQIIIVANGAPMLNGSLVKPAFGEIGQKIVASINAPKRVALVAYDDSGILISKFQEMDSRGIGIEMLVQWPLSAITIPACLLGLIVFISLLPILGRPQQLPARSTSDFGMHIHAMGQLIYDSRDQQFALDSIAEYYRVVRNEKPPAWVVSRTKT